LQIHDFVIEHRKGSENVVADTLYRMIESIDLEPLLGFETTEFESPEYAEFRKEVLAHKERFPDLVVDGDYVFLRSKRDDNKPELGEYSWKLWIPASLTRTLIEQAHSPKNRAHGGMAKTLSWLRQRFHWPGMVSQVRAYVRDCTVCKETKPTNCGPKPDIGSEVVTFRPFQKIYIDFLGKYPRSRGGNSYVFIVVDHFSKFTLLKGMREATSAGVIRFLRQEVFNKFGVPALLHSNNGKQFASKQFSEFLKEYGVKHIRTAVYSPQSNAAERVNQSVLNAIRAYLEDDHRDWDLYLSEIKCALRGAVHQATGVSPTGQITNWRDV